MLTLWGKEGHGWSPIVPHPLYKHTAFGIKIKRASIGVMRGKGNTVGSSQRNALKESPDPDALYSTVCYW